MVDTPHPKKKPAGPPIPFVPPQLATLVAAAPEGSDWLHEVKFDGFRILCRVQDGEVTLFTRTGQDWTGRFAEVAAAAGELNLGGVLLDGEVAVLRPDGTTSFQALQNLLQDASRSALTYFVFDLLYLDGEDFRQHPLEERKAALAALLPKSARGVVRYTDHVIGNGGAFYAKAGAVGLEGIVSKKRDEPYHSGRAGSWLKTKFMKRQEFVVGGFTEPEGSRSGIGALLVGFFRDGELIYAGKVGTGFSQKAALAIRQRLDRLVIERSAFQSVIRGAGRQIHWVTPELVAEVAFSELTADGKLRHPSYQGLREDKPAREVVQEMPKRPARSTAPEPVTSGRKARPPKSPSTSPGKNPVTSSERPIQTAPPTTPRTKAKAKQPSTNARTGPAVALAGVKLTHPERLLEENARVTKRDLAEYYAKVAPFMLPHLVGRPLSLVRCPEGTAGKCFFMKHAAFATPDLRRVTIQEKEDKGDYLIVDTASGLVGLAQMSVLEIHTWNSVDSTLEMPDRVVFDFDPGPDAAWEDVVDGALRVKERLEQIGCAAFLKTTGGKGLHVVVPLRPIASWDECKVFSQLVSESVVTSAPKRFTTAMRKAGRERMVLIDYFRNHRGSTSVSVFSTRARPGIPVSVPIAWDELATFRPGRPFTMASTLERLLSRTPDPWRRYEASRVDLKKLILGAKPARTPRR
jgi:bifunctional non-homologous end joining protein LigD